MPEITGPEPTIAEGFGIGLVIVVIAGKHRRADAAYFTGFKWCQLLAVIILNRHLHTGAFKPTGANARMRTIDGIMKSGRQHRNTG